MQFGRSVKTAIEITKRNHLVDEYVIQCDRIPNKSMKQLINILN